MHLMKPHLVIVLGAAIAAAVFAPARAERPADFGQQWVRTHPFTLMGLQQSAPKFDAAEHRAANMSNVLVWWADGNGKQIAAPASAGNLPWHALIVDGEGDERDRITDYASVGNSVGWMLGDEVDGNQMAFYDQLGTWIKQNRPNDLVYTNALPTYAGFPDYPTYLEQIVDNMHPDVLMYDHYPYVESLTRHDYFQNMMFVRDKALEHNLPYWAFMQSSALAAYRLPSKSDIRMQAFTHLAAGFTGLAYFTFDNEPSFEYASILDSAGIPTSLYPIVADLNKEAANLGKALRFMKSTDVKYVPGRSLVNGVIVPNDVPLGMTGWTAANDPDKHIEGITVQNIGAPGTVLDALVGFFKDDNGDDAFMLVNTHHGPSVPQLASITVNVTFDTSIQSILELDRLTGEQRVLAVGATHQLSLSLPAGTGRLFKYNEGNFLVAAVPEPSTLVTALVAMAICPLGMRRHSDIVSSSRTKRSCVFDPPVSTQSLVLQQVKIVRHRNDS
jgi:hypothetical protein